MRALLAILMLLITGTNACFFDSSCNGICCWTCTEAPFECWYPAIMESPSTIREKRLLEHAQLERSVLIELGWDIGVYPIPGIPPAKGNFSERMDRLLSYIDLINKNNQQNEMLQSLFHAKPVRRAPRAIDWTLFSRYNKVRTVTQARYVDMSIVVN